MLALFLLHTDFIEETQRPEDLQELTKWLAAHPADWLAASAISDSSLDSALPQRVALWRSAYALANYLAPRRRNPRAAFVRGGLFHWYELSPADRRAVLVAAEPLLQDPSFFTQVHRPLWQLTRDLEYLRRVAPKTISALTLIRELAVESGRFADYRELRSALRKARIEELNRRRASATSAELLELLPPQLETGDEPLLREILQELDRRASDPRQLGGPIEAVTLYAIRHHIGPLTALSALVETPGKLTDPTRARLALALGDRDAATRIEATHAITGAAEWIPYHLDRATFEEKRGQLAAATTYRKRAALAEKPTTTAWANTCGTNELCSSAFREHRGPLRVTLNVVQSDEVAPYVELYRDDMLVAEGEVRENTTFEIPGSEAEVHRTEVRLVNRYTRNGTQRRARLS
jgi:hypothetical protein